MGMDPLVYVIVLLGAILVAVIVMMGIENRNTRLTHRVEELGGTEVEEVEEARSIRRTERQSSSFGRRVAGILQMPIDMPNAYVIAPPIVFLLGVMVLVATYFVCAGYVSETTAGVLAVVAGFQTIRGLFGWQRRRYQGQLLQQLPDAIEMVVSAIRAGLPVGDSFRGVAAEMPSPTKEEFTRMVAEMALGTTADKALLGLYLRTRVTEYSIFAVTVSVQTRSGGKLVESVQKLAETVRHRLAMATRAKALAGEARVSAIILGALPFFAGAALSAIRPGYLDPLFNDPRGKKLLVFAAVGMLVGIMTMRRMIRRATAE